MFVDKLGELDALGVELWRRGNARPSRRDKGRQPKHGIGLVELSALALGKIISLLHGITFSR